MRIIDNLFLCLESRGLIKQKTSVNLEDHLSTPKTIYVGFDPTSDSLHVGHLLPIMAMKSAQAFGHRIIALIGGATALIGDPSGKIESRPVLSRDAILRNSKSIEFQLRKLLGNDVIVVNNIDWFEKFGYIEFLRDVGIHFSVNRMLQMESTKLRMEKGLNFVEFNYMLLQAYDFLHLYKEFGCSVQMGGSDQFGNMIMGTDLVRRVCSSDVHGIVFPLLMTPSGQKMGKTEKGALWLDPDKTSPHEFYQYFMNVDDSSVSELLRLFTFLHVDSILQMEKTEDIRELKKFLAHCVTSIVHGVDAADKAESTASSLFGVNKTDDNLSVDIPTIEVDIPDEIYSVCSILADTGICKSKGDAKKLIANGGVSMNGDLVGNPNQNVMFNKDGHIIFRIGKKRVYRLKPFPNFNKQQQ